MTTNIQQGTLLDVLKKKMRQTKEEMEKYKDECEEYQKRLQGEIIRREEVSSFNVVQIFNFFSVEHYLIDPNNVWFLLLLFRSFEFEKMSERN